MNAPAPPPPQDQLPQLAVLIQLYEGSIKFLQDAETACQGGRYDDFKESLARGRRIVEEFKSTINHADGGEIAIHLNELYEYILNSLTQAELTYDPRYIRRGSDILRNLLEGWRGI